MTGRRLTIQIPSSPVTESEFKLPAALPAASSYDGSYVIRACSSRLHRLFSVFIKKSRLAEDGWKEKDAVQRSGVRARAGRHGKHEIRSRGLAVTFSSITDQWPHSGSKRLKFKIGQECSCDSSTGKFVVSEILFYSIRLHYVYTSDISIGFKGKSAAF